MRAAATFCQNLLDRYRERDLLNLIPRHVPRARPIVASDVHCFAAQPEYFRTMYYDLVNEKNTEFPVKFGDAESLKGLKSHCIKNAVTVLWLIRPEFFETIADDLRELSNLGVLIVAYSTEPIPTLHEFHSNKFHHDKWLRLKNLLRAKYVPSDFFIHYDFNSEKFLKELNFKNVVSHYLPTSEKIFYPSREKKTLWDACFLGRSTPYREHFLMPLKAHFNIVHIAHGMNDSHARLIMTRSKMVINIHNEPYLNFEHRIMHAKFCERPILSEPVSIDLLPEDEIKIFKEKYELYEIIKLGLENPASIENLKKFSQKQEFTFAGLIRKLNTNENCIFN